MPRKLFIDNAGLDSYADDIRINNKTIFDILMSNDEAKEKILNECKMVVEDAKVVSMSITAKAEIRIRFSPLILTEPRLKRKFYVGSWELRCDESGRFRWYSTDEFKDKLEFKSGCWGDNTIHPHINGNTHRGCLGNAETPMIQFVKTGELRALTSMAIGYLETTNIQDSAGKYIGYMKELELDDKGEPIILDINNSELEKRYKFKTDTEFDKEKYPRDRYVKYITGDNEYGTGTASECPVCEKYYNIYKMKLVHSIGKYICNECSKNMVNCDICGDVISKHPVTHNGITYCNSCAKEWLLECKQCGEIIPNGLTKEIINDLKTTYGLENYHNKLTEIRIDYNKSHTIQCINTDTFDIENLPFCDDCKGGLTRNPIFSKKLVNFKKYVTPYTITNGTKINWKEVAHCPYCGNYVDIMQTIILEDKFYCSTCALHRKSQLLVTRAMSDDTIIYDVLNNKIYRTLEEKQQVLFVYNRYANNANARQPLRIEDGKVVLGENEIVKLENTYPLYVLNKKDIKEEYLCQ